MRVIAGDYKSRPLRALSGMKTRPTSDRLRETLFNVLTAGNPEALEGTVWLDLFAGTGAVGIEALSRGAAYVTFVDRNKAAVRVIQENLRSLGIRERTTVLEQDVNRTLRDLETKNVSPSYVFLDPPYADREAYQDTLAFLAQSPVVGQPCIVIAEHDKREDPGEAFGELRRYRLLEQGDGKLSFYRKK
jgi:16S rRNA (guanine(966)-N(2))-methyltransferase RsmD